jgi:ubiquitin carboxyl-terminal hydrolase 2/21
MNSILQCLSNTKCLLEYCLQNSYQSELNTTLSVMKGSLFNSYASLIKQMWSHGGGSLISPQDFKSQIARFAPRFVGYAQQDAEFLYYLLKGLHEDVNLIKKKPPPFIFDEKAWDRMRFLYKKIDLNFSFFLIQLFIYYPYSKLQ